MIVFWIFFLIGAVIVNGAFPMDPIMLIDIHSEEGNVIEEVYQAPYDPCLSPVVLVPGLGGSVLDYQMDETYESPHEICKFTYTVGKWSSGPHRLWPSLSMLSFKPFFDCWKHAIEVSYDSETKSFANTQGVDVRPRAFGSVKGIDNLFKVGNWGLPMGSVFEHLINELKPLGYVDERNMRGAPYDFRTIPETRQLHSYYDDLRALIEETYENSAECPTGPKPVHVISHSLGCVILQRFLSKFVDDAWKDKYVASFIPVSGPFGGSAKAFRTLLSGDSIGIPGRNNQELQPVEATFGGVAWMLPFHSFHDPTRVFVSMVEDLEDVEMEVIKTFSATTEDFTHLFGVPGANGRDDDAYGFAPLVADVYRQLIGPMTEDFAAPGVDVYCMFGTGIVTEDFYMYQHSDVSKDPLTFREAVMHMYDDDQPLLVRPPDQLLLLPYAQDEDSDARARAREDAFQGDGTVELASLARCQQWQDANAGKAVEVLTYPGTDHTTILTNEEFLKTVVSIVSGAGPGSPAG
eukprot:Rmarinus@m.5426